MNENFDTNWDPYEHLIQCQENINQLAIAFNTNTANHKHHDVVISHQQEVIQQLMFQNKKLSEAIRIHTAEIQAIKAELQLLKQKITQK